MSVSKNVLITGASRGLGEGMARHFAERGYGLALTARNPDSLADLVAELEGKASRLCVRALDVTDHERIAPVLRECAEELDGIDIVVVNAGIAVAARSGEGKFPIMRDVIEVNLVAGIATADAAMEYFRERGRGQLVGITSVAGLRGMRNQGAYSASKAGFSKYLEALRCETYGEDIVVTDLAPGYIDTDLNRSLASRPFVVSAERGTSHMVDLIERGVGFRYVPPWPWQLVAQCLKVLPVPLLSKM
jgi:short-subunit dehydrogenase